MRYLLFVLAIIIHNHAVSAVPVFKKSLPLATFITHDTQDANIGIDATPNHYLATYRPRLGTFSDLHIPFTVYTNTRSAYTKASDHYSLELIDSTHWCDGKKLTDSDSVSSGRDVSLNIDGTSFDTSSSLSGDFTNTGDEYSSNEYSLVIQFPLIPQLADATQLCEGRVALLVTAKI